MIERSGREAGVYNAARDALRRIGGDGGNPAGGRRGHGDGRSREDDPIYGPKAADPEDYFYAEGDGDPPDDDDDLDPVPGDPDGPIDPNDPDDGPDVVPGDPDGPIDPNDPDDGPDVEPHGPANPIDTTGVVQQLQAPPGLPPLLASIAAAAASTSARRGDGEDENEVEPWPTVIDLGIQAGWTAYKGVISVTSRATASMNTPSGTGANAPRLYALWDGHRDFPDGEVVVTQGATVDHLALLNATVSGGLLTAYGAAYNGSTLAIVRWVADVKTVLATLAGVGVGAAGSRIAISRQGALIRARYFKSGSGTVFFTSFTDTAPLANGGTGGVGSQLAVSNPSWTGFSLWRPRVII